MKLVFDDQAIADLENVFGWIAQDSPATARTVTDRLFSSIELLISFPLIAMSVAIPTRSNGWSRGCHMLWCTKSIGSRRKLS
jgi:plasmid stabilization system protein ParE